MPETIDSALPERIDKVLVQNMREEIYEDTPVLEVIAVEVLEDVERHLHVIRDVIGSLPCICRREDAHRRMETRHSCLLPHALVELFLWLNHTNERISGASAGSIRMTIARCEHTDDRPEHFQPWNFIEERFLLAFKLHRSKLLRFLRPGVRKCGCQDHLHASALLRLKLTE